METQRDLTRFNESAFAADVPVKIEVCADDEFVYEYNTLPIVQYTLKACKFQCNETDCREYGDKFKTGLFTFTRIMKAHPKMEPYFDQTKKAFSLIEDCLATLTQNTRQTGDEPPYGFNADGDYWQMWFDIARVDAQVEFFTLWPKIRYIPGRSPLSLAIAQARRKRLKLHPDMMENRPDDDGTESSYTFFISIAGHLQVITGNHTILLPCEKIAEIMNVSKMTIHRFRNWAEEDGFLRTKKKHSHRDKKATKFRFDVTRVPLLEKLAQVGTSQAFYEKE